MSLGLSVATVLQTFFVILFLLVLMPFNIPERKAITMVGGIIAVLCIVAGVFAALYGLDFLSRYGYLLIALPIFVMAYLFSTAKGSRFVFVMMTTFVLHRIVSILLMALRVHLGGYTSLYFIMNFIMFGALLYGAFRLRTDFHKIVFSFQKEFVCLSSILVLLLTLIWILSPVNHYEQVDYNILRVALLLYLLVVIFYLYIGISFRSFSSQLDTERNALSLGHQMQAAQDNIKLMQVSQENTRQYRHDLHHHILTIRDFLNNDKLDELQHYLSRVDRDIETIMSERYCSNEAANLILAAFITQTARRDIRLEIAAEIPQLLPISDTELCTLLANALQNAVAATAQVEKGRNRMISLRLGMTDGRLLLLVENPYTGTVRIENGLPQSDRIGHGFGTKSMETIAEKYGGLSSFKAQDGIFTVRIVI